MLKVAVLLCFKTINRSYKDSETLWPDGRGRYNDVPILIYFDKVPLFVPSI